MELLHKFSNQNDLNYYSLPGEAIRFCWLIFINAKLAIVARIQASGCTFGYFIVYYKNFLSTSLQLTSNVQPKLYLYQPFLSSDRELMLITFYGWLESLSVCGKLCGKMWKLTAAMGFMLQNKDD